MDKFVDRKPNCLLNLCKLSACLMPSDKKLRNLYVVYGNANLCMRTYQYVSISLIIGKLYHTFHPATSCCWTQPKYHRTYHKLKSSLISALHTAQRAKQRARVCMNQWFTFGFEKNIGQLSVIIAKVKAKSSGKWELQGKSVAESSRIPGQGWARYLTRSRGSASVKMY